MNRRLWLSGSDQAHSSPPMLTIPTGFFAGSPSGSSLVANPFDRRLGDFSSWGAATEAPCLLFVRQHLSC